MPSRRRPHGDRKTAIVPGGFRNGTASDIVSPLALDKDLEEIFQSTFFYLLDGYRIALLDTRSLTHANIVRESHYLLYSAIAHPSHELLVHIAKDWVAVFSLAEAREMSAKKNKKKAKKKGKKEEKQQGVYPLYTLAFERPITRVTRGANKRRKVEADDELFPRLQKMEVSRDGNKVIAAQGECVWIWDFSRQS